jgi:hypothetical protein
LSAVEDEESGCTFDGVVRWGSNAVVAEGAGRKAERWLQRWRLPVVFVVEPWTLLPRMQDLQRLVVQSRSVELAAEDDLQNCFGTTERGRTSNVGENAAALAAQGPAMVVVEVDRSSPAGTVVALEVE